MHTNERERTVLEAAGYIAGVGFGIIRSLLRPLWPGHFASLVLATMALIVTMLFVGTTLGLAKVMICYVAVVVLVLGHALLEKRAE